MERVPEPSNLPERELLTQWLAFHRSALAAKCADLSAEQLVEASAEPSDLTLLGLVRHLTEMEHVYLVHAVVGGEFSEIYCTDDDPDADIVGLVPAMAVESLERWRNECRLGDTALGTIDSLDGNVSGNRFSLRWNLIKLIQEYARHNGHADLIRERIDGATGE